MRNAQGKLFPSSYKPHHPHDRLGILVNFSSDPEKCSRVELRRPWKREAVGQCDPGEFELSGSLGPFDLVCRETGQTDRYENFSNRAKTPQPLLMP